MSVDSRFGEGLLASLGACLRELGATRALVVTGPSRRHLEATRAALGDLPAVVFDGARVHVPTSVVEEAREALTRAGADAVVALGGGAAVGLGKALRLDRDVRFVAVPTTYAGSEQTSLWGITDGEDKRTGRDERVRPDLVLYDVALTLDMPRALTTRSLMNALAHPISALDAGDEAPQACAAAIGDVVAALEALSMDARDPRARRLALRGAARAAQAIDRGRLGVHHRVAHRLGGRFALPHAGLHAALLPSYLASRPEALRARVAAAAGLDDPAAFLFDALIRAGAATSLMGLGVDGAALLEALAGIDDVDWVRDAYLGRRPCRDVGRVDLGGDERAACFRPPPASAERVVVAVHGRGATSDSIVARARELVGDAPGVRIVAPQAPDNRWYARPYHAALAEHGAAIEAALDAIDRAIDHATETVAPERVFLFGFSQGACLALEHVARRGRRLGGVVAWAGARIGPATEQPPVTGDLDGMPVLLGAAEADGWVGAEDIERAALALEGAGARVSRVGTTGERHEISLRQRLIARELLLDAPLRDGRPGFGNAHESEALPGALPRDRNSPRRCAYGLYAEQLSGTGFTATRHDAARAWLYRIRPSSQRRRLEPLDHPRFGAGFVGEPVEANLCGFRPLPYPDDPADFVDGLWTFGGAGDPRLRRGYAVHLYAATRSMEHRAFYDADGDLLLLPQEGGLTLLTEQGALDVEPGGVALVPRGLLFAVLLRDRRARGWVAEVFGPRFRLPDRGPVGANGLADARHFRAPTAWFEDRLDPGFRVTAKLGGRLHEATQDHSPFDVVAWHGELAPYVYDLAMFSPVANVRVDHPDPSIYTVLGAPMDERGASTLDLVVFPARWDATEGTFRPPFFHRNVTTEINGIVREPAVAGAEMFVPGATFVTPSMTPHGVLARAAERALAMDDATADAPLRLDESSLWFQLETALPLSLTPWARDAPHRHARWERMWGTPRAHYRPG